MMIMKIERIPVSLWNTSRPYAIGGYEDERKRVNSSSTSENGDGFDDPPHTLSPPHNGHPQCPSSAGASDGAGRTSIHPRPATRRTSRGGRERVVLQLHCLHQWRCVGGAWGPPPVRSRGLYGPPEPPVFFSN